jgi:hypothetical protein
LPRFTLGSTLPLSELPQPPFSPSTPEPEIRGVRAPSQHDWLGDLHIVGFDRAKQSQRTKLNRPATSGGFYPRSQQKESKKTGGKFASRFNLGCPQF